MKLLRLFLGSILLTFLLVSCGGSGNSSNSDQASLTLPEKMALAQQVTADMGCVEAGQSQIISIMAMGENLVAEGGGHDGSAGTFEADMVVNCGGELKAFDFLDSEGPQAQMNADLMGQFNQNPIGEIGQFYQTSLGTEKDLEDFLIDAMEQQLPPCITSYPAPSGTIGWGVTETLSVQVVGEDVTTEWFISDLQAAEGLVLVVGNANLEIGVNVLTVDVSNPYGTTSYHLARTLLAEAVNTAPQVANLDPDNAFAVEEHSIRTVSWKCLDNETDSENLLYTLSIDKSEVFSADSVSASEGAVFHIDVDDLDLSGEEHSLTFGCTDDGTDNNGGQSATETTEKTLTFEVIPVNDPPKGVEAFFPMPIYADSIPVPGTCTVDDPDGTTQLTITWYVNKAVYRNEGDTFDQDVLDKGQTLKLECNADGVKDIFEAVVQNSPPEVGNLAISPAAIFPGVLPVGIYSFSDLDGDGDHSQESWYVNGSYKGSSISPGTFTVGDTLLYKVTPYDGTDYGEPQSVSVKVQAPPFKRVFVSSQTYTGNLGGLAGADAKCQTLANSAGLTGNFKAWLSDTQTSAADRLTHSTIPYGLLDSNDHPVVVAQNWNDLTDGTLNHAIVYDEHGNLKDIVSDGVGNTRETFVFTNTSTSGLLSQSEPTYTCGDWTLASSDHYGAMGKATVENHNWTGGYIGHCHFSFWTLYCFEQ